MNKNSNRSNLIPNVLLGFAVIGFLILWLLIGGSGRYSLKPSSPSTFSWELLLPHGIGIVLIAPYLIYLFMTKPKSRLKLTGKAKWPSPSRPKNNHYVYIQNKSGQILIVNRNAELGHGQWHIFQIEKHEALHFSNGIIFELSKNNELKVQDSRNQVKNLNQNQFRTNNVPIYVKWAVLIAKPNQGG